MNNIFKKILMGTFLTLFVLCVPIFAEEVIETETQVCDETEIEVVEKESIEFVEVVATDLEDIVEEPEIELEEESEIEEEIGTEEESSEESETITETIVETTEEIIDATYDSDEIIATISEIIEDTDEIISTASEVIEDLAEKCEVVVYWLTDMKMKEQGNGGTYNYSWDKFLVDKGSNLEVTESIPGVIKHSSCDQEYTLIGFTTENQINNYWKGADYAGGEKKLDKDFVVDSDIEIYAVYDAKYTYISSIIIDKEITYKTTTIPNKAIKNISIFDTKDNIYVKNENIQYYRIKNNLDDVNYMFTKDISEGAPIKVEDFSLDKYNGKTNNN